MCYHRCVVVLLLGLLLPFVAQAQTVPVHSGLAVDGTVALSGTLTPAALAGNVDDYNPTGLATASTLRLDGGAADRTITGIQGGTDGRLLTIVNIGTTNNLLLATDTTSTAAYRFLFPASVTLVPTQSITLRYDGTTQRWRDLTGAGSTVDANLYLTDVTTGNSSTGAHGLLPKLSGNAAEVLKGDGTWGTDATGTATPGGSDGQVQYRSDATTFGGSPGLVLDADGITGERRKCVTVTADPAPMTARCYFVDTSGGNVTLTLPNAAMSNGAADVFDIYKVTNDANQLILNADTGDLINFVDQDLTTTDRGAGFHIEEQDGAATGNWMAQRVVTSVTAAMLTFSATDRVLCRDTAGAGAGEECDAAALKGILALASSDLSDSTNLATLDATNAWSDGVKQTFNPNATNAGINVGSVAGDPASPANGDLWYDSTDNELTAYINGAPVALGAGSTTVHVPIRPYSAIPVTAGLVFGTIQDGDEMLGVADATTLTSDAIWRLGFEMPPTLDAGCTYKLQVDFKANATANDLIINPKWAIWAAGSVRPSGGGLTAEGNTTITATGSAYQLIRTKITLDAVDISGAAGDRIAMDLTIVDSGTTMAVVSGLLPSIICE